jgi:3-phenylpropionate/trans-cinnamate dioxygenase ferredoxin reductase subunit
VGTSSGGSREHDRVVVVGAGDCGTRVALRLRELGHSGPIVLVGDEGREPYERPPLSKSLLTDEAPELRSITTVAELAERSIEWIGDTAAVRIDPDRRYVELADRRRVSYESLVIATGARPRRPAFPGTGSALSIRSATDALVLRGQLAAGRRIAIIGGGFIGLETAANARASGCEVVVLEFAHQLMARVVPAAIADSIRACHVDHGVDLRLGTGVSRLDKADGGFLVVPDDGDPVSADVVVAGTGAVPNTDLAATAGLVIADGVAVDSQLRTTDPAIFAAGDCCSVPHPLYDGQRIRIEAWRNAVDQAEVVAQNLLGGDIEFDAVPSFWSDQYDLTVQVVGLHAAAAGEVVRRREDGHLIRFGLDLAGRVVSASGIAPGTTLARDIRRAEQLIAARATPAPVDLSDPDVELRSLL